jgi:23S rRNA pseudouridine1911/1915/1917 synthase
MQVSHETEKYRFTASADEDGKRLDSMLAEKLTALSRSLAQKTIDDHRVWVNGRQQKQSYRVSSGDVIEIDIPAPVRLHVEPEDITLEILYEDPWIVVVNKPAGMVVHPACGNYSGTLVNALLYHCTELSGIGGVIRPGIVHRLDKGTSGVLVVAKNDHAHRQLSEQFKQHTVQRTYKALVFGDLQTGAGTIKTLIGRDRANRQKMSAHPKHGREAITHWEIIDNFGGLTMVMARLETGRTHQVRVHLSDLGHPIVGDGVYGSARRIRMIPCKDIQNILAQIKRPLLHANTLRFRHPEKMTDMIFEVPLPNDFAEVVSLIRQQLCFA